MRNTWKIFPVVLCLLPAAPAWGQDLVILHTNDTHSQLETVSTGKGKGKGGIARRLNYFNAVRSEAEHVLVLDAGDYNQGTPYFTVFKGDVETDLMNVLGYDVAALGNHEFDNGMEELARRLSRAEYRTVCANYDFTGTPLEPYVRPYVIEERAGRRIGIIGLLVQLEGMVSAHCREGLTYQDPVDVTNRYAAYLKNEAGCDLVIVLSHLGFSGRGDCDVRLAEQTEYVDLIIGGHSHTFLKEAKICRNRAGREVPVVQAGAQGEYVGRIDLSF